MANFDLMPNAEVPDKRVVSRQTAVATVATIGTMANYADIATVRTRLAAINGAFYTTAKLAQMTNNDMVYALRILDDPLSI